MSDSWARDRHNEAKATLNNGHTEYEADQLVPLRAGQSLFIVLIRRDGERFTVVVDSKRTARLLAEELLEELGVADAPAIRAILDHAEVADRGAPT